MPTAFGRADAWNSTRQAHRYLDSSDSLSWEGKMKSVASPGVWDRIPWAWQRIIRALIVSGLGYAVSFTLLSLVPTSEPMYILVCILVSFSILFVYGGIAAIMLLAARAVVDSLGRILQHIGTRKPGGSAFLYDIWI